MFAVLEIFKDGKTFIRFEHKDRFECEVYALIHQYDNTVTGKLVIREQE